MNVLERLCFAIVIIWFAVVNHGTFYNAKENHRHLHQIGCHVGIEDDCQWLRKESEI